jgi:N-acetyl-beta-hexosaminidase
MAAVKMNVLHWHVSRLLRARSCHRASALTVRSALHGAACTDAALKLQIVDIESFPYASEAFPQLAEHGAYHPREIYTAADIARVVHHALERGIRVIPEIDTPGHVWAGFAAIDGLLTTCYDGAEAVGTGPLDPSKEVSKPHRSQYSACMHAVFC